MMHQQVSFMNLPMPLLSKTKKYISAPGSTEKLRNLPQPPNNFRDVSVYPTKEDFIDGISPFLRPNVVQGSYEDVEHYLDIQFRLMREDLLVPLRQGIKKLQKGVFSSKKVTKIDNIKIYGEVKFGNPIIVGDKIGRIVHFVSKKNLKKLESSKSLMYGSLVLFTNDNFASIICATVLGRTKDDVIVLIYNENEVTKSLCGHFFMIESDVYFEPCKHILNALKSFNDLNFPMKKYIVSSKMNTELPQYLLDNIHSSYNIDGHPIKVSNIKIRSQKQNLDDSQLAAFRAALTQEFVVIQGPPGTGKTFIGLQITETLLNNSNFWNQNGSPMLVVCHTNHALDQFLEGILEVTNRIVRIGGQSKSYALQGYNLKELRKNRRFRIRAKCECFSKMREVMKSINTELCNLTELNKVNGIVSHITFTKYGVRDIQCFMPELSELKVDEAISQWLLQGIEEYEYSSMNMYVHNESDEDDYSVNDDELEEKFSERRGGEEEDRRAEVDVDILQCDFDECSHNIVYSVSVEEIRNSIIESLRHRSRWQLSNQREIYQKKRKLQYLKHWLNKVENLDTLSRMTHTRQLQIQERWAIYKQWVNCLKHCIMNKICDLKEQYKGLSKAYEKWSNIYDLQILRSSLVVGMTTSGAARLQTLLQKLTPKIVIVEEAAEVLESHTVVSLTKETHQLILIGDHKQLQPAVGSRELAESYKLNVSLFERMINNGMHCYCLENQHRMRPEISKLIAPSIYPTLKNHPSVYEYPPIKGVTKSIFFISHNNKEEKESDSVSPRNQHEAEFLIALCEYLLCQGYGSEEITILCPYNGQLSYLKEKQREISQLKGVHIAVVDNYQGEENKIILLSLVRSNPSAAIGFLKKENRVCVALSRAREGFYIIGNMENLTRSSTLWAEIKKSLVQQDAFGTSLTLQCQNHCFQKTDVKCKADFLKVKGGGCSLPCQAKMECGHFCEKKCHMADVRHGHEGIEKCKWILKLAEKYKQRKVEMAILIIPVAIAAMMAIRQGIPAPTVFMLSIFGYFSLLLKNPAYNQKEYKTRMSDTRSINKNDNLKKSKNKQKFIHIYNQKYKSNQKNKLQ